MAEKKGLVRNEFDQSDIRDALYEAFHLKKEEHVGPYKYVEASGSLVIKDDVINQEKTNDNKILNTTQKDNHEEDSIDEMLKKILE